VVGQQNIKCLETCNTNVIKIVKEALHV
jgi:hypothetical protein